MKISDELTAFEFDAAVTFAEREFEQKERKAQADYLAMKIKIAVAEILTGKKASSEPDEDGEPEKKRIVEGDFEEW